MSDGLYSISGFFRNDQPNGLGISFKGRPEELTPIRDAIMSYDEPIDDETAGWVKPRASGSDGIDGPLCPDHGQAWEEWLEFELADCGVDPGKAWSVAMLAN